jgi:hypothetical protein
MRFAKCDQKSFCTNGHIKYSNHGGEKEGFEKADASD